MNTPEPYERRLDRTVPELAPTPSPERPEEALAVHRDPSVPTDQATPRSERARFGIAWVRPSEMPTVLGSRYVRRGIDVEAALARRARRVPGAAISAASRRITRTTIGRPEATSPTINGQEGLGL